MANRQVSKQYEPTSSEHRLGSGVVVASQGSAVRSRISSRTKWFVLPFTTSFGKCLVSRVTGHVGIGGISALLRLPRLPGVQGCSADLTGFGAWFALSQYDQAWFFLCAWGNGCNV